MRFHEIFHLKIDGISWDFSSKILMRFHEIFHLKFWWDFRDFSVRVGPPPCSCLWGGGFSWCWSRCFHLCLLHITAWTTSAVHITAWTNAAIHISAGSVAAFHITALTTAAVHITAWTIAAIHIYSGYIAALTTAAVYITAWLTALRLITARTTAAVDITAWFTAVRLITARTTAVRLITARSIVAFYKGALTKEAVHLTTGSIAACPPVLRNWKFHADFSINFQLHTNAESQHCSNETVKIHITTVSEIYSNILLFSYVLWWIIALLWYNAVLALCSNITSQFNVFRDYYYLHHSSSIEKVT